MHKYKQQRKKRWYDPTTRSVVILFLIMLLVNWILNFDITKSSFGSDKKVDKNKALTKEKILLSYSPKGEAEKIFGKMEEKKLPDPFPEIIIEELPPEVKVPTPKAPMPKAPLPRPVVAKISCKHPSDNPSKSKTKKHSHMDEDCCPDPDEYPKPGCVYSAKGLSILKKPKK